MTILEFEEAALAIVDKVRRPVGRGRRRSPWATMVAGFRAHGSCDARIADEVEDVIRAHVASLRAAALRRVWAGSESGANDPDPSLIPTEELRRLLVPELLARITEIASDEAHPPPEADL